MAKALAMAKQIRPPRRNKRRCNACEIGDFELRELTLRLMRGENLSGNEAANFLGCLLNRIATDEQIAAALVSLAVKGETFEELAGIAEAMRNRALPLRSRHKRFIDTAGTGSSAAKTFNISTAAAFVIAGADLPVAKHGSRAATSRCGSADVLQALGVNTVAPSRLWNVASTSMKSVSCLRRFSMLLQPASRRCVASSECIPYSIWSVP